MRQCVSPEPSATGRAVGRRRESRLARNGVRALARRDFATAVRAFRPVAQAGDAEGQFRLGLAYARGEGVIRSVGDAVVWLRAAAEQGHAEAQYNLALAYLHGGQSDAGISEWYRRAGTS